MLLNILLRLHELPLFLLSLEIGHAAALEVVLALLALPFAGALFVRREIVVEALVFRQIVVRLRVGVMDQVACVDSPGLIPA